MSRGEQETRRISFQQQLDKLRLKIDALPEDRRPHLHGLANEIEHQHRQLQDKKFQHHAIG